MNRQSWGELLAKGGKSRGGKDMQILDVPGCGRKVLGPPRVCFYSAPGCPHAEEQFQEQDVHLEQT